MAKGQPGKPPSANSRTWRNRKNTDHDQQSSNDDQYKSDVGPSPIGPHIDRGRQEPDTDSHHEGAGRVQRLGDTPLSKPVFEHAELLLWVRLGEHAGDADSRTHAEDP